MYVVSYQSRDVLVTRVMVQVQMKSTQAYETKFNSFTEFYFVSYGCLYRIFKMHGRDCTLPGLKVHSLNGVGSSGFNSRLISTGILVY